MHWNFQYRIVHLVQILYLIRAYAIFSTLMHTLLQKKPVWQTRVNNSLLVTPVLMWWHLVRLQHISTHIQIIGSLAIQWKNGVSSAAFLFDCIVLRLLTEEGGYFAMQKCSRVLNDIVVARISCTLNAIFQLYTIFCVCVTIFQIRRPVQWKHVSSNRHNCNL